MGENFSFYEKVERVNEELRSFGVEAVQEIKMMKDGKVIGQIKYGYKPQYVFDAVNKHIGVECWRYETINVEQHGNQMVATVELYIRMSADSDNWLGKGQQVGHMGVVKDNVGDARKGAVTAAIQKCMSLCSIGSDAFKGKLEAVWKQANGNSGTPGQQRRNSSGDQPQSGSKGQKQSPSAPPPAPSNSSSNPAPQPPPNPPIPNEKQGGTLASLPTIEGVTFEEAEGGVVVAKGSNLLKKRLMLQAAGFTQDRGVWSKQLAA